MKRPTMTREQLGAAAALLVVLLGCVLTAGYALWARFDAAEELSERREVLSRLARGAADGGSPGQAKVAQAPPTAFIDAPTQGQAGAQLQSYFSRLALAQQATMTSSGVEAPTQEAPDAIRIQATLEISLDALQALLYQLEAGTPYLTVDSIGVQTSSAAARQSPHEAPLRVTLMLRGLWHRGVSSPAPAPAPASTPAQAAAEPGGELLNPLAAQSLESLFATRSQPLFVPARRPPAPPSAPPPPAPVVEREPDAPQPPALTLFGIVMEAEGARAIVRGPGNESLRLRVGDRVGDWAVTEVERRRLVLSHGDRSETFSLFGKNPGRQLRIGTPAMTGGEQLANSQRRGLSPGSPGASGGRTAPAREEPEL
jgi:hypothetical protein